MKYQYKRHGAGNVFRKHKKKVECFFRDRWCRSIIPEIWDYSVLNPITEESAIKLTTPK
jgi:hypothetical protein